MKTLIVEDDFISRKIMKELLASLGECDIATDGEEAVQAFRLALDEHRPYDLVCMDIMMPNMDGHEALEQIREIERGLGLNGAQEVKVIMTTALDDPKNVVEAFYRGGATSYLVKPITKQRLMKEIRSHGLL
ncbi:MULTISPECIES: response regulator [Geobacter]|uniref:Chemotaxis protein CheY n=2 Tax=Geobacter TaxID=28231 RepID=A0A0C1QPV5_9BACT|nr:MULTISPECIES: response regulator [Geobacter]ANA40638.1 two-component system response regulator [Geobacter anodireducens]KIE42692.1 chemotaxis protein CheY [Geobacter soli]MBE2888263.1 response regulator [Geobacter anodireducens]HMN02845.1 response regulator [Geobacter anodireducens]